MLCLKYSLRLSLASTGQFCTQHRAPHTPCGTVAQMDSRAVAVTKSTFQQCKTHLVIQQSVNLLPILPNMGVGFHVADPHRFATGQLSPQCACRGFGHHDCKRCLACVSIAGLTGFIICNDGTTGKQSLLELKITAINQSTLPCGSLRAGNAPVEGIANAVGSLLIKIIPTPPAAWMFSSFSSNVQVPLQDSTNTAISQ